MLFAVWDIAVPIPDICPLKGTIGAANAAGNVARTDITAMIAEIPIIVFILF